MHFKITAFALGVFSVYGISNLPPLGYLLMTLLLVGLAACKWTCLWNLFALVAGFAWLVFNAGFVVQGWLPPELENQHLLVSGRVYDLPQQRHFYAYGKQQHVYRFVFNVDCAQLITKKQSKYFQQYFARALEEKTWAEQHCQSNVKKVLLQWYDSEQKITPGQRWLLVIRAKRPHGYANPGGFDYEKWLFQQGIGAVGYVKNKAPNQIIPLSVLHDADVSVVAGFSAALVTAKIWINSYRYLISENINRHFANKDYAALVSALVVGDRRYINDHQTEVLQRTGTAHLLAVSGLHIGLLAGVVYFVVSVLIRKIVILQIFSSTRKIAMLMALLAALIYSALAGFSTPTIRALLMLATFSWYLFTDKEGSVWDGFFWALFWVLIVNPLSVLSSGFWLSFIAVFSILLVMSGRVAQRAITGGAASTDKAVNPYGLQKTGLWQSFLPAVRQTVFSWVFLQWAVFIGLLPLAIVFFAQLSLIAPAVNLLAIPVFAWLVVPLSLLGGLSLQLLPEVGAFLLSVVENLLNIIWPLFAWASSQALATQSVEFGPQGFLILPLVLGVMLLLLPKGMPLKWLTVVFMLPLLFAVTPFMQFFNSNLPPSKPIYTKLLADTSLQNGELNFTVLDVGQGLSAVVQTANHVLVYDAGYRSSRFNAGEDVILPYLQHKGIQQLDLLLLSHDDNDHTGGAGALLKQLPVSELLASEKIIASLDRRGEIEAAIPFDSSLCSKGGGWQWDGVNFYALSLLAAGNAPQEQPLKDNNQSCVLKIWNENISILLPGDLEKKAEKLLLNRLNINPDVVGGRIAQGEVSLPAAINLKADILLAPHHGSKSSTSFAFLEAVSPKHVIFAVGYLNRFGHPHPLVKARYENAQAKTFSTALKGAIEYKIRHGDQTLAANFYRDQYRRIWHTLK